MPTICLSRSKHLIPFVALLNRVGEPVDRKLSKARLPGHCVDDPETVIPADRLFHFRELCGQALGQDDIALEATRELQITSLGEFGRALLAAPTLYRLLTTLRDHLNTQSTITEIELRRLDSGDVTFCYRFDHLPEVGVWHSDLYTFGWIIKIIRLVVPTWAPDNIWSISSALPSRQTVFEEFGVNRVEFQSDCTGFLVPSSLLALAPAMRTTEVSQSTNAQLQKTALPQQTAGAMHQLIDAYADDRWLSIEQVAEVLDLSVRTIQRRLSDEGTTFTGVLEQSRMEIAGQSLETTDLPIKEIAHQVGYSSQSNFTRAFCRWAGVSPSEFRRQRNPQGHRTGTGPVNENDT